MAKRYGNRAVNIRLPEPIRDEWQRAARLAGQTLSDWVRESCQLRIKAQTAHNKGKRRG
jgi:hypothetical protein